MNRVLVTGGSGFIGRRVVQLLDGRGFEVHSVQRSTSTAAGARVACHSYDLLDHQAIRECLEQVRPTHLVHLAWFAEHGAFWSSPNNLDWVCASIALVRTFSELGGQRVLVAGSCAEYDWSHGCCRENTTPLLPNTLYGAAKNSTWQLLKMYAEAAQLSLAWGRLFFLFGPDEHPRKLVRSVADRLLAGEPAPCSSGHQVRDFMHVDDAAAALVSLLESGVSGAVNIGSGHPVRVVDVVKMLGDLVERPELLRIGDLPDGPEDPCVFADASRLRREVGFTPSFELRSGLADVLQRLR